MIGKKYLKGGQVKLDANKDGKISAADFSLLRKGMKKYQGGGKAPDMESRKERMYLEIRKDAERMEKEMKRQGMSQEEINKKLDAYMEKAMKDAQYSTNMKKQYSKGGKMYQRERIAGQMQGEAMDAYRKKSKAKMQKGGKVVKYQGGGKTNAAKSEREQRLAEVRENSQQMARERALMQKVGFAQKRAKQTGAADWSGNFSQEEMDLYRQIQENGMTKELPKPYKGQKYQEGGKVQSAKSERGKKLTGKEDPAKLDPSKRAEFIKKYAIKKKKGKVVKYQGGGKAEAAKSEQEERLYTGSVGVGLTADQVRAMKKAETEFARSQVQSTNADYWAGRTNPNNAENKRGRNKIKRRNKKEYEAADAKYDVVKTAADKLEALYDEYNIPNDQRYVRQDPDYGRVMTSADDMKGNQRDGRWTGGN
jgi:hypothetical protein